MVVTYRWTSHRYNQGTDFSQAATKSSLSACNDVEICEVQLQQLQHSSTALAFVNNEDVTAKELISVRLIQLSAWTKLVIGAFDSVSRYLPPVYMRARRSCSVLSTVFPRACSSDTHVMCAAMQVPVS